MNAARVEKSYFDSRVLDRLGELARLGLEQGRDTLLPEFMVRDRFKPFVEDELPAWCKTGSVKWTPHPLAPAQILRRAPGERAVLAIGPEGGWVPFEIELLSAAGFVPASFGTRPLRVEVAVAVLLGALGQP